MSYYYKFNFVSPEPVYATIKEELKSYFDTGAIDDLMFPTYLDKCLKKLGRSTYVVAETALYIEDFVARLPDNFIAAREVWMCAEIPLNSFRTPSSVYTVGNSSTIQVTSVTECDDCPEDAYDSVIYKINAEMERAYVRRFLLTPGNISLTRNNSPEYNNTLLSQQNPHASSIDSFDIRDNKIVTTFREGIVHLVFYTEEYDDVGNQLIPDNYRVREYIEKFIKYKMFEFLFNQINDETFNQIEKKFMMYKQEADEAYIIALTEMKKEDVHTSINRIKKSNKRFDMYEIRNRMNIRRR